MLTTNLHYSNISYLSRLLRQDLEASLSSLIAAGVSKNVLRRTIPTSVLSKMLQSPFSLSADIDLKVNDN